MVGIYVLVCVHGKKILTQILAAAPATKSPATLFPKRCRAFLIGDMAMMLAECA
jgi:hypothetical protein